MIRITIERVPDRPIGVMHNERYQKRIVKLEYEYTDQDKSPVNFSKLAANADLIRLNGQVMKNRWGEVTGKVDATAISDCLELFGE